MILCLLPLLFGFDLLGLSTLQGRALAAGVEILIPRPGSMIIARIPNTHLILRRLATSGVQPLEVQAGFDRIRPLVVKADQGYDFLHFTLPLVPGVNRFSILPSGEEFEIRYQAINSTVFASTLKKASLFHSDEELPKSCSGCHNLRKTGVLELLGLEAQESCNVCHQDISKKDHLHNPVSNRLCLTCHQLSRKPWRIGFPTEKTAEICIACHTSQAQWQSRKYVHGPMIVGGCTVCHNPHGGDNRKFLWSEDSFELCITCHSDKDHLLNKEQRLPYVHGLGTSCVVCHDPHASNNIFVLKKPINELCVGCHYQFKGMERGHPVDLHPLAGPKERRRPGRELSCASCHDPHGSSILHMLIKEPMDGLICRECHK